MTEIKLVKLEIKKGKKDKWLNWCDELKKRQKEVIETLKKEGVKSEACFISENGEEIYYFMEADNLEKAKEVALKSNYKIDSEHKSIKTETLEKVETLKQLFFFKNE